MIAVTGASGQLGQLVIENLLAEGTNPETIIALARSVDKIANLKEKGIQVRHADYEKPETLTEALKGVNKLLLISSSEVGKRLPQHMNVIAAAKNEGVKLLAYTSLLKADTSTLGLAPEHIATEEEIEASGLNYIFLRNGWYTENYTISIPMALEHGAVVGAANDGKISSAPRNDYALAAAKVLTTTEPTKKIYELAGDTAFTLTEFAAEIAKQTGKEVVYNNLTPQQFEEILVGAGLPQGFANLLADTEDKLPSGQLYSESKDLSQLMGRPTEALAETIKKNL